MFNIFLRFVICVLTRFRKITRLVHLRLINAPQMRALFRVRLHPLPNTTNVPNWACWCSIRTPKHAVWACLGFRMEGTYPQYKYALFQAPTPILPMKCAAFGIVFYYPHISPLPHSLFLFYLCFSPLLLLF